MMQLSSLLPQEHTSNYSSSGATKSSAEGNGVLDMDVRLDGERSLVVAS